MSDKFLWMGLTFIVAFPLILKLVGLGGVNEFAVVGSILMVIGTILKLLDK